MKALLSLLVGLFLMVGLTGCTCHKSLTAAQPMEPLNVAIWKSYIAQETLDSFEKQTGIKVHITYYSSNEDLYAKIKAGAKYDIAVPSDYMVAMLAKENLLAKLEAQRVPSQKNVSKDFLDLSFDRKNQYSLPYAWTTTGVAYDTSSISAITSWNDILAAVGKEKVLLLDSMRDVTGSINKLNGASVNSTRASDIKKLEKTLTAFNIRKDILSSDSVNLLKEGKANLVQAYSSDGLQAMKATNGKIQFVLPKEGVIVAVDNLVIPKNVVNKNQAYRFINYILTPETNAVFVREIMGGPVVSNVQGLVSKELAQNKALFPDKKDFKKFERLEDLGKSTKLYDSVWSKVTGQ